MAAQQPARKRLSVPAYLLGMSRTEVERSITSDRYVSKSSVEANPASVRRILANSSFFKKNKKKLIKIKKN